MKVRSAEGEGPEKREDEITIRRPGRPSISLFHALAASVPLFPFAVTWLTAARPPTMSAKPMNSRSPRRSPRSRKARIAAATGWRVVYVATRAGRGALERPRVQGVVDAGGDGHDVQEDPPRHRGDLRDTQGGERKAPARNVPMPP